MSTNISVSVRIRPLLPSETNDGMKNILRRIDDCQLVFDPKDPSSNQRNTYAHGSRRNKELCYAFDRVFGEEASQQDVFEGTTQPLIPLVLDGFNATVFAYGATGCGKTHTISGSPSDPGIIHRTFNALFSHINSITSDSPSTTITLTVSYLEVYNETIRDLLTPACVTSSAATSTLDLREDDESKRVTVSNLSEHSPETVDQVLALMTLGNKNRIKAFTEANAVSSRSHAVLQVYIHKVETVPPMDKDHTAKETHTTATLSIIDLAGSERASSTKNKGTRLLEGANINRSLLALGNCINALCSSTSAKHIPYRDSKLTRLLKYSLQGTCRVVMITNISPASVHYEETGNTLKYANRAKEIKTRIERNDVAVYDAGYAGVVESLRREVEQLKKQLASGSNNTTQLTKSVDAAFQEQSQSPPQAQKTDFQQLQRYTSLHAKISTLYTKLHAKQVLLVTAETHISTNESKMESLMRVAEFISTKCSPEFSTRVGNAIMSAVDRLSVENVRYRHNCGEYEAAMGRYRGRCSSTIEAETELSLLYREKVQDAVKGMEERLRWERDRVYAELMKEEAKKQGDAGVLCMALDAVLCDDNLEIRVSKFLEKVVGVSIEDETKEKVEIMEMEEEWAALDEDSVSECDVSIAYDCASETESECGDRESIVGDMENLLDEMEAEMAFDMAFENANVGGANAPNQSLPPTVKTPVKEMELEEDEEATPMAKPAHRESLLSVMSPFISSARKIGGRISLAASLNTTPVAAKTRVLDLASAAEPPASPFSTRLKQSLLPIMKPRTPTKSDVTPKTGVSAIPVPRTSSLRSGLGTATRSMLRKQGEVRAETPVGVSARTRGASSSTNQSITKTPAIPVPSATRVLRSTVQQSTTSKKPSGGNLTVQTGGTSVRQKRTASRSESESGMLASTRGSKRRG
ncbi:kinesin-like protein Klp5 [Rhizoclosmatium sp. JEL0117]|nr:kinesin-like protein Klp5 [Rhizoclosmatium sp. JEL0117]